MIENFFKKGTPDTLLSTGLIKRNLKIENDKSLQGFRDYSMTLKKAFNTIINEKDPTNKIYESVESPIKMTILIH